MIKKNCKTCGKEFVVRLYRDKTALYCSRKCIMPKAAGWNRGTKGVMKPNQTSFKKGLSPWNKGLKGILVAWNKGMKGYMGANKTSFKKGERVSIKTEFKKSFTPWNKGKLQSLEARLRMSESHKRLTGEKAGNWKGGKTKISKKIRGNSLYTKWRMSILERDSYTCQSCKTVGGILEIHHLERFADLLDKFRIVTLEEALVCMALWDINNGVTLCKKCHGKINRGGTKT